MCFLMQQCRTIEVVLHNMSLQCLSEFTLPGQESDSPMRWCSLANAASEACFYWYDHCAVFACGVAGSICEEPLELHKQPACRRGSCQRGHDIPPQSGALPGPSASVTLGTLLRFQSMLP